MLSCRRLSTKIRTARTLALSLVVTFALAGSGGALTYEYAYSGVVTSITDAGAILPGSVLVGSTFTGGFAYDDSIPDLSSDPANGFYEHPASVGDISLELGPISGARGNTSPIRFHIENNTTVGDSFVVNSVSDLVLTGVASDFTNIFLILVDSSAQVLPTDALPSNLLLANYDNVGFPDHLTLVFASGTDLVMVGGVFTSLVQIPEPGTGALVATGCLVLAAGRRRRA